MPSFLGGMGLLLFGLLGLGLARNYILALVFIFLVGFGFVTLLSTGNTLLQLNVPDELRGRIMSLFGLIVMGFAPLGSLLHGSLAHYLGPGPTIALGSVLAGVCTGVVLLRHPELRRFDFSEPEPSDPPRSPT
jgi:MFS family permease